MTEAQIGALMLFAALVEEREAPQAPDDQTLTELRREKARAQTAERRADEAATQLPLVRRELDDAARGLATSRRWAAAWKRVAKDQRDHFYSEARQHERTAEQLKSLARERALLRKAVDDVPRKTVDLFLEYAEGYGYTVREARRAAVQRMRRELADL